MSYILYKASHSRRETVANKSTLGQGRFKFSRPTLPTAVTFDRKHHYDSLVTRDMVYSSKCLTRMIQHGTIVECAHSHRRSREVTVISWYTSLLKDQQELMEIGKHQENKEQAQGLAWLNSHLCHLASRSLDFFASHLDSEFL